MFTSDSRRYFALFFQKLDVWELFSKFPYDMRGNRALGFSDKDGSSPIFSAYSREIQRLAGFLTICHRMECSLRHIERRLKLVPPHDKHRYFRFP